MGQEDEAMVGEAILDVPISYDALQWARWYEWPVAWWLCYWDGHGDWHQADFFQCHGCRRLVSWHAIRKGPCACGLGNRLSPVKMTPWRKAKLLLCPFLVRR